MELEGGMRPASGTAHSPPFYGSGLPGAGLGAWMIEEGRQISYSITSHLTVIREATLVPLIGLFSPACYWSFLLSHGGLCVW